MGTLLDLASLVTIPSGYKVGTVYSVVPTDGAGDLTFTRSNDTATRVGPNGLIEKVRTNFALRSQSFATTAVWSTVSGTVTDNAGTAPDGTNTASKIVAGSTDPYVYQSLSLTGQVTTSCYVKGVGSSIGKAASIRRGGDLTTFTITGDWQRVSVTATASGAANYGIESPDPAVSGDEVLLWGFQVEYGDVVTDYIATTTTAVSVGPVANLPRLDYLNSTCPNLLLEPQRSNIALYSEQFNNSAWLTSNVTVTANNATSPDGYINADAIVENTATSVTRRVLPLLPFTGTGGAYYSFSAYVKKIPNQPTRHIYWMCQFGADAIFAHFNMTNFTVNQVATSGNGSNASASIIAVGNDWYRITLSGIVSNTGGDYYNQFYFEDLVRTGFTAQDYTGNGTSGFYLYGWQIEAGAYATSYVPTLGAASTRGVDVCSKTSATALIGQTAGTLYSEFVVNGFADFGTALCVNNNAVTESIWLTTFANGDIRAEVFSAVGGGVQASFIKSGNVVGQKYKIAIGYAANNFAFFVNGVQVGTTDTSGTVPVSMSRVDFDYTIPSSYVQSALAISEVILFPTRLSNAELAQLTTL